MTAAIVLAGGRSRRFGADKLAARLPDGRSVLAHAVAAVDGVADAIAVVVAPGAGLPDGLPERTTIVRDPEADGGPLLGLVAGLEAVSDDIVLLIGGDMPALEAAVLRRLVAALRDDPAAETVRLEVGAPGPGGASVAPGGVSAAVLPCALRRSAARVACRDALAAGDRRLRGCLERLATTVVPTGEWRALDPAGRTLLDVDRPGDLAAVDGSVEPG